MIQRHYKNQTDQKTPHSTLFTYLLHEYSERFVQPVVQPAAKCKRAFTLQRDELTYLDFMSIE